MAKKIRKNTMKKPLYLRDPSKLSSKNLKRIIAELTPKKPLQSDWIVWAINGKARKIYLGTVPAKDEEEAKEIIMERFSKFHKFKEELDRGKIFLAVEKF